MTFTFRCSKALSLLLFLCLFSGVPVDHAFAQPNEVPEIRYGTANLIHDLEKLAVCGTVLYVAAHPDDENTRLIAYLANERKYNTVYLSLTRGDGGQNLIGKEQGEAIGIIRTHELLEARKIDGGKQHFTRAYDFGYSKSPDETFSIWNKQEVLADVVWAVRYYQPDVIITRFPEDGSGGHGHHTASALLAREAFKLAADSNAFKEQLKYVRPWQVSRLYWNAWVMPGAKPSTSLDSMIKLDVGLYNPVLGKSYTELAGESRSMHKSQGFGAAQTIGSKLEYLQLLEGSEAKADFMEGVATGWNRISKDKKLTEKPVQLLQIARTGNTVRLVQELANTHNLLKQQAPGYYQQLKLIELRDLILAVCGLKSELLFTAPILSAGQQAEMTLAVTNRSEVNVSLNKWSVPAFSIDSTFNQLLKNNQPYEIKKSMLFETKDLSSQPGWLRKPKTEGMFSEVNQKEVGLPVHASPIRASISVTIEGTAFEFEIPVLYKSTDPVKGELTESVKVYPNFTLHATERVYLTDRNKRLTPSISITSRKKEAIEGRLVWLTDQHKEIKSKTLSLSALQTLVVQDTIVFNDQMKSANLFPVFIHLQDSFNLDVEEISYDHIGKKVWFPRSRIKVINEQVFSKSKKVGYIAGPGDEVAEGLKAMGIEVVSVDAQRPPAEETLSGLDAVVVGVRAYNTNPELKNWAPSLIRYVEKGGIVLIQYQIGRGLASSLPFPYPMELGRGRVTEERASIRLTGQGASFFETPNKITAEDWNDWVQERGLYFAQTWDDRFLSPIAMNDKGDKEERGSLLILPYGKGMMIYTGLSFFRQIPAGVPGAYKLLGNLFSKPDQAK